MAQIQDSSKESSNPAPSAATAAVLKPSDPVPAGTRIVSGINFDQYEGRNITAEELLAGMANMGFQASSVAEAVRIINDMVLPLPLSRTHVIRKLTVRKSRDHGETPKRETKPLFFWATQATSSHLVYETYFDTSSNTDTSPQSSPQLGGSKKTSSNASVPHILAPLHHEAQNYEQKG